MGKDLLKQALGQRKILYTKCNLCGEDWNNFICPDCLLKLIEIIRDHEYFKAVNRIRDRGEVLK